VSRKRETTGPRRIELKCRPGRPRATTSPVAGAVTAGHKLGV
jgi:hypothetical protein